MKITAPLAILLINLLMKATPIQEVPSLDLEFIAEEFLIRNIKSSVATLSNPTVGVNLALSLKAYWQNLLT